MSEDKAKPPFSPEDVARMVAHMNEDHADSVLAYVQHFAKRPRASAARLLDVTPTEMRLAATTAEGEETLRIPFDHPLASGHDAHMTMVKMSKRAKRALGNDAT